jgi:hypothetical protein
MRVAIRTVLFLAISLGCIQAQRDDGGNLGAVDTVWPGVRYELVRVERIPPDRLLVAVRLVATRQAAPSGTFIGTKMSKDAPKNELVSAQYAPRPFSLASSQMVGDQTGERYPALSPITSGAQYIPGEILTTLLPGEAEILTVQFAAPASMASAGSRAPKQTASFLFPNAKAPIAKVEIPPAAAFDSSSIQSR